MNQATDFKGETILIIILSSPLTTVVLITAVRAVRWIVTSPGVVDALTVSTLKLWGSTRSRCLWVGAFQTTQLPRLVPSITAVCPSIAQLVSGHTRSRQPTGNKTSCAVLAGSLITPVATVVYTIAEKMKRYALSAKACKFFFVTPHMTCEEWGSQLQAYCKTRLKKALSKSHFSHICCLFLTTVQHQHVISL